MSVVEFKLNEDMLKDAVIKAMDKGNIDDAFMFCNKLITNYPTDENKLLLSELYSSIDKYDQANQQLIELYTKTQDKDYLKRIFDNNHDEGDLVSLVRYLGIFPSFDYLDFIFQYAGEIQPEQPKNIKVVYPINDADAVEILEMARREFRAGNYKLSNEIIDKHSLSKSPLFVNAIYLKTNNFIKLKDYQSILDLGSSLVKGENKREGYLIMFFAGVMLEKYDEADSSLNEYISINKKLSLLDNYATGQLNEEFVELVMMDIVESFSDKTKYTLLSKLLDEFELNSKFTYYNLVIKYLLGQKDKAYKLLAHITNIYKPNCFSYLIKTMFDANLKVSSIEGFSMAINNFVIANLLKLEKIASNGDINLAREMVINDKQTNEVVKYILTGVKAKSYNKLSDILFLIFNKDISTFIRKLLINTSIYDEAKEPLVKILIDKDSNKNIDLVLSNVYMNVDFTYPLDHIINSVYNGYYNILLFVLQRSYRLQDDIYILQKNIIKLDKLVKEKNIDISSCSSDIVAILLYNNIKGIMIDVDSLLQYYNIDKNMYNNWKTLIFGSEQ